MTAMDELLSDSTQQVSLPAARIAEREEVLVPVDERALEQMCRAVRRPSSAVSCDQASQLFFFALELSLNQGPPRFERSFLPRSRD